MATGVATRQRIIRRPRLVHLLNASPARIKLLVAPAGYGKTTLAQQWLAHPARRAVWYRGGSASGDVAALAAGLSRAAGEIVPGAGKRMRARIRAVGHAEEDVDLLAELFAEDIQNWPEDGWLVIDDYQFAMDSAASERFVDHLTQQTTIGILVTSRRRPKWASARRILYGEIQEVDRQQLAMNEAEGKKLLGQDDGSVARLLNQAAGWPAVLGLAALSTSSSFQTNRIPTALYEYFAEEIVSGTEDTIQLELMLLALARSFDAELAETLLGDSSAQTLDEGLRLGVLVQEAGGVYEVHPLLAEFLEIQLRSDTAVASKAANDVGQALLMRGRSDEAFDLAERFSDGELMEDVLEHSFDELLREGRVATIGRWLARHPLAHSDSPIVYLAEAETAYRHGEHVRTRELADRAAARFQDGSPLKSRAFARAGQSSLMASHESEGLQYFRKARRLAQTPPDVREALMGLYIASSELGLDDAQFHLEELASLDDGTPETTLRIEAARLTHATRGGGHTSEAIEQALPKLQLIEQTADPLASTAFLHMLANALNLASRYEEASQTTETLLATTKHYRLAMPVPHALLNQALARHGRREYAASHASLNAVRNHVGDGRDLYLEFSVRAIKARVYASEGRLKEALEEVSRPGDPISSPPLRSEYLASRSLVHALNEEPEESANLAHAAQQAYRSSGEARVLAAAVAAINSRKEPSGFAREASHAWEVAEETGNFDGLVCSYRAYPPLLRSLFDAAGPGLEALLHRAGDVPMARRLRLPIRTPRSEMPELLTPREIQVFDLLRSGLSNRAIADALVVSEATVKVHLRHIYEKLGVRTRTEALAQSIKR
jgi:LuxR family transcriptional regulator, maltose regulon positive regulatory protein